MEEPSIPVKYKEKTKRGAKKLAPLLARIEVIAPNTKLNKKIKYEYKALKLCWVLQKPILALAKWCQGIPICSV